MAAETWMDAPQAVALGFADETFADGRVSARAPSSSYPVLPAALADRIAEGLQKANRERLERLASKANEWVTPT
jgi:hypothetical protein